VLTQVDTDITAKVAEALAVLNLYSTPGVGGADENLTGTSTRKPSEAELQNPPADVPAAEPPK
jgi:hypothetical protein